MTSDTAPGTGDLSAVRSCYLATAQVAADLLARPQVARGWDAPSVLERMTVGDLAAHLARSVHLVAAFLDADAPDGPTITAEEYYGAFTGLADLDSDLNTGVRTRSREEAAPGPAGVADRAGSTLASLTGRLAAEPAGRRVVAYGGRAMTLDEFLRTRLVELCVHVEDLALSLVGDGDGDDAEVPVPDLPPDAVAHAVDVLAGAARVRHGDRAVLRALSRRERDDVDALRSV